jgi:phosphatidate cytidylyltransferase
MVVSSKKHSNVIVRSLTTLAMIGGFIGTLILMSIQRAIPYIGGTALLLLGHIYMIILVFVCQTLVYREVTALFALSHNEPPDPDEDERQDPWSKTLNWYFFAVTNYFLYGETIIYYFKVYFP